MTDEKILEGLYWIRDSVSKGSSDNWQNALKALDVVIDEYLRKVETKACINCDHFSDREFYTDNTVTACAVSFGSCTKCQRNITSTSPHTEVPSWCPLKGDKE